MSIDNQATKALRACIALANDIVALSDLSATGRLTRNNLDLTAKQMTERTAAIDALVAMLRQEAAKDEAREEQQAETRKRNASVLRQIHGETDTTNLRSKAWPDVAAKVWRAGDGWHCQTWSDKFPQGAKTQDFLTREEAVAHAKTVLAL